MNVESILAATPPPEEAAKSNAYVDYDGFARAVRSILAHHDAHTGRSARIEALLHSEVPRLLGKVEQKLTDALRASGEPAEVAATSANFFVAQLVDAYLEDRRNSKPAE